MYLTASTVQMVLYLQLVSLETDSEVDIFMQKILGVVVS